MGKIIAGVVAVGVVVAGIFFWQKSATEPTVMMESTQTVDVEEKKADLGVVASIKDAMGLGKSMQCTYSVDAGGRNIQSTVMVNGDRYQSTTVMGDMTTYALFDGETQYMWTSAAKTGTKMDKACLEEMKTVVKDMPATNQEAALPNPVDAEAAFDAAKNVSCTPASSEMLAVPLDVTFTDQCEMMKQSMDMMKQMQDKMPQNMPVPSMMQY